MHDSTPLCLSESFNVWPRSPVSVLVCDSPPLPEFECVARLPSQSLMCYSTLVALNCWTLLQFRWTENWTELDWTADCLKNNFSSRKSCFFETSSTFFLINSKSEPKSQLMGRLQQFVAQAFSFLFCSDLTLIPWRVGSPGDTISWDKITSYPFKTVLPNSVTSPSWKMITTDFNIIRTQGFEVIN